MAINVILFNRVVTKWLKDSEDKLKVKENYERLAFKNWRPKSITDLNNKVKKVGKLLEIEINPDLNGKEEPKKDYRIGCFGRYKVKKVAEAKHGGIFSFFVSLFQS